MHNKNNNGQQGILSNINNNTYLIYYNYINYFEINHLACLEIII